MLDIESMDMSTLIAAFVGFVAVVVSGLIWLRKEARHGEKLAAKEREMHSSVEEVEEEQPEEEEKKSRIPKATKGRKNDRWGAKPKEAVYEHPWLLTTLKGHSVDIGDVAFAQDGKRFVSVSADSSLILWDVRDFSSREHKSVRAVLEFDTATRVAFAPDSRSVVMSVKRDNKLIVYSLSKRPDTGALRFSPVDSVAYPPIHHLDIAHVGISSTGKFVMSASPDCKVVIYSLRGEVLKTLEPKMNTLFCAVVSPDGRFVAVSGFTPDVQVYEVLFSRTGEFQDAKKAFNLTGANSGVYCVSVSQDASRMLTVSKDGSWRVYATDIRYGAGQDAQMIASGPLPSLRTSSPDHVRASLSPSGGSAAIAIGDELHLISVDDVDKHFETMTALHPSAISSVHHSPCGQMIATSGGKVLRVVHNVAEMHNRVVRLSKSIPTANGDAAKRRIQEEIEKAEKQLIDIQG